MENTENTELVIAEQSAPSRNDYDFKLTDPGNMSLANIVALSKLAAKGGMSDPRGAEGLAIRSVFGVQMGFTPVEGMQGLYLIEGKPVVGAQLLAKRVKQSGKYDYRVIEHDNKTCKIEGFELVNGERVSLGFASFNMEQAAAAGLANRAVWKAYPENMLFARAMANLHRWHMPDLIGSPFYTEGEDPIIEAEPSPVVATAQKAMEAATTKAAKGRAKDAPKPEPAEPVVDATFVEEKPDQKPDLQVQTNEAMITTEPESAPEQKIEAAKPEHVKMDEAPTVSNGGLPNPFETEDEAKPLWDGKTVYLRTYTHPEKQETWVEVVDKKTGTRIEGMVSDKAEPMIAACPVIDDMMKFDDKRLAAEEGGSDTTRAKIAQRIRTHRLTLIKNEAPEPAAEETIESIKESGDDDFEGMMGVLKFEIGEESVAKIAADAVKRGVEIAPFVTGKAQEVREGDAYKAGNEMKKFQLVITAWTAYATAEAKKG